jgi:hypothetical protein
MANSRKKDILERYRNLLESNLIITDDLIRWFKDKKVLPDFVFDDIKVCTLFISLQSFFIPFVLIDFAVLDREK